MIDIHSHIIYDVDDGAKTIEESLKLLEEVEKNGTTKIIATSHRRKGMFETSEEKILENFETLKKIAKKKFSNLTLYYGAEIYYTKDVIKKIREKEIPTLANSNYVLIEFDCNISYKEILKIIYEITLIDKIPIIAHVERYNCLSFSESRIKTLVESGAYIQVNSSSVLSIKIFKDPQKEYKKRTNYLLEKGLVHFVASDIHNITNRNTYMKIAYEKIKKKYGEKTADKLFKLNQIKIIENKYIN